MNNISKALGTIANIATILVAATVGILLVKNHFATSDRSPRSSKSANLVGTKISLPDVNWNRNQQTLLVILQDGCRYCSESASFYQAVAADEDVRKKTQLIAVFPPPILKGEVYLKRLAIPITDIREAMLETLDINGTPTLLLVDLSGVVGNFWQGKLPANMEKEVLEKLR